MFIKNDKTPYIIKSIDNDTVELIDAKTKKNTVVISRDDIVAKQDDLFGGKSSTEAPKKKKYKRQYKNVKSDAEQTSLF